MCFVKKKKPLAVMTESLSVDRICKQLQPRPVGTWIRRSMNRASVWYEVSSEGVFAMGSHYVLAIENSLAVQG